MTYIIVFDIYEVDLFYGVTADTLVGWPGYFSFLFDLWGVSREYSGPQQELEIQPKKYGRQLAHSHLCLKHRFPFLGCDIWRADNARFTPGNTFR